jgi:DNA-binding transcriptional LysR family regulator
MPINFDLHDLQAFVAAAEIKSFKKAAELINISQPAFSRRIEKLESSLGVKLIDRDTRKMELTSIGRDSAKKAKHLLEGLDEVLLGIQGVGVGRMGEITIACVPSAVYYFLPQVLRKYHENFPQIRIKIHDASANEVLSIVASGEADFGVNFVGSDESNIEFKTIFEERFVVACRKDHPLSKKKKLTWEEVSHYDFMSVSKSSGNRMLIDLALAGKSQAPKIIYEAQHVTTLLGMVEAGMGIAVVPSLSMPNKDHPVLASIPLFEPVVSRRIGLIKKRGRSLAPAAEKLYELLLDLSSSA